MTDSLDTLMRELDALQERAHAAWAAAGGHPDEKALAAVFDGLCKTGFKVKVLSSPGAIRTPSVGDAQQQDWLTAPFARHGDNNA